MTSDTTPATTETPPPPRAGAAAGAQPTERSARAAQWALMRFEAFRMLRHPAFLVAVLGYAGLWGYEAFSGGHGGQYPILQDQDRHTQVPLLLLAAGALLAAHLAVSRARRHGAEALCDVLALPLWRRTLAHLVAVLPLAAVAAALAEARIAYDAAAPTAVGSPSLAEVATGPVVVLLAGCAGVALACLTTAASAAPFAVLLLGGLVLCSALGVRGMKWVGPVGVENEFAAPLPTALMHRPAGLHLAYLAAVTLLLALLALVRSGLRARPARAGIAVVALAAVVFGAAQYRPLPGPVAERREAAEQRPGDHQRCRAEGNVTFCAFPEFLPRTRDWQRVTEGVLGRVPADRAQDAYAVRQRLFLGGDQDGMADRPPLAAWARDDARHGTPGAVTVGTQWGTDEIGGGAMLGFAVRFADRVVSGPAGQGADEATTAPCHARAVTVLWLAAQATADTSEALRSLERRSMGGITVTTLGSAEALSFDEPEVQVVLGLLDEPAEQVGDRLTAAWSELTDAATSTERAAELLGAPAPAPADHREEDAACAPL